MNDIKVFENNEFGSIRTMMIDGEPWFVGKDVAEILGYSNSRKAIADHIDDEDKGVTKCDTLGGVQDLVVINESGLYGLILSSKLPSAKRFKHWVTSEVLPSIRKTGTYSQDLSSSVSREEVAMFYAALQAVNEDNMKRCTAAVEAIGQMIIQNNNAIISCLDNVSGMIGNLDGTAARLSSATIEVLSGIAGTAPRTTSVRIPSFINTMNAAQMLEWRHKVEKIIGDLRQPMGIASSNDVIRTVFDRMLADDGYDVDALFEAQAGPLLSRLDLVKNSDELRRSFERAINLSYDKYIMKAGRKDIIVKNITTPDDSPKSYPSIEARKLPRELRQIAEDYAKKHNTSLKDALHRIYLIVSNRTGIDLNAEAYAYAKNHGYSRCSKGYFIINDPEMYQAAKPILDSLLAN